MRDGKEVRIQCRHSPAASRRPSIRRSHRERDATRNTPTLEHLLLALIEDNDAAAVMRAMQCRSRQAEARAWSSTSTPNSTISSPTSGEESKPTAGFQRVISNGYCLLYLVPDVLLSHPERLATALALLAESPLRRAA